MLILCGSSAFYADSVPFASPKTPRDQTAASIAVKATQLKHHVLCVDPLAVFGIVATMDRVSTPHINIDIKPIDIVLIP